MARTLSPACHRLVFALVPSLPFDSRLTVYQSTLALSFSLLDSPIIKGYHICPMAPADLL